MKKRIAALLLLIVFLVMPIAAHARGDLDEILNYTVTVDVNADGTLHMVYHIEWKVLDSDSDGPLTWVKIGIPNSRVSGITGLSSSVSEIAYSSDGGDFVRIDLDRSYYEDEVVVMDFSIEQDYMYQVDEQTEGETVYRFTPGWFDEINVDEMMIKWNRDKVLSHSPACPLGSDGYYTWTGSLSHGETMEVSVTYPNDAFGFDATKSIETSDGYDYDDYDDCDRRDPALEGGHRLHRVHREPSRGRQVLRQDRQLHRDGEEGHPHEGRLPHLLPELRRAAARGQGQLPVLRIELHKERGGHNRGADPRRGKGSAPQEYRRHVPLFLRSQHLHPRARSARGQDGKQILAEPQPQLLRAQLLRLRLRMRVRLCGRRPRRLHRQGFLRHRSEAQTARAPEKIETGPIKLLCGQPPDHPAAVLMRGRESLRNIYIWGFEQSADLW